MSGIPMPTPTSRLRQPLASAASAVSAAVSMLTGAAQASSSSVTIKRPAETSKENVQSKKAKTDSGTSKATNLTRSKSYGNLAPPPVSSRASTATSRKQPPASTASRAPVSRSNACANITQRLDSAANSSRGNTRGKQPSIEAQMQQIEQRVKELENQNTEKQAKIQVTEAEIVARSEELQKLRDQLRSAEETRAMEKTLFEHKLREMEFEKLRVATELSQLSVTHEQLKTQFETLRKAFADLTSENGVLKNQLEETSAKLREEESMRRVLHNEVQELKGNIRVFCRIRPVLPSDKMPSAHIQHLQVTGNRSLELVKIASADATMNDTIANGKGPNKYDFTFDRVFGPGAQQAEVFKEIAQLVQSAVDGYNVCIFAYGQTGSGKTFTMEGGDSTESEGMIPRSVRQVFSTCQGLKDRGWTYTVEASFFEIYNEQIRDLIAGNGSNLQQCELRVSGSEVFVSNLRTVEVQAEGEVQELLAQAQRNRAVAATKCNEYSSRSHSIFKLFLKGSNSFTSETSKGSLYLVDLAGSERLKESGATGDRLTEMKNINKSLSNLGNVIMALSAKNAHVPYRNSKLTHILQNTLGGSAKTLMFINVSPKESSFNETLNSLRFAAKVNQCHIGTATKSN